MAYTIAVCTVKTPDDGQRNCPKLVEFHFKKQFEKLGNQAGFIMRNYIYIYNFCGHVTFFRLAKTAVVNLSVPAVQFGYFHSTITMEKQTVIKINFLKRSN
jgi:hypothetical protein